MANWQGSFLKESKMKLNLRSYHYTDIIMNIYDIQELESLLYLSWYGRLHDKNVDGS